LSKLKKSILTACMPLTAYIFWHEVKYMLCADWLKMISL
jgi:hypothetical protein